MNKGLSVKHLQYPRLDLLELRCELVPHPTLRRGTFRTFHKRRTSRRLAVAQILAMSLRPNQSSVYQCAAADFCCSAHESHEDPHDYVLLVADQITVAPPGVHKVQADLQLFNWMVFGDFAASVYFQELAGEVPLAHGLGVLVIQAVKDRRLFTFWELREVSKLFYKR